MKSALKTPYPVFLAFILLGSHYHCPFYCISTTLKRICVPLPPSPPFLPPSPVTINLVFVSKDSPHLHISNKLSTHPLIVHDGFFHLASCFKGLSTQHASVLHPLYGRRISQNTFFFLLIFQWIGIYRFSLLMVMGYSARHSACTGVHEDWQWLFHWSNLVKFFQGLFSVKPWPWQYFARPGELSVRKTPAKLA